MMNKRKTLLAFFLITLLAAALRGIFWISSLRDAATSGQIIFCNYTSEKAEVCNLMIIDTTKNQLVKVIPTGGLPTFSKNGELIAAKCIDPTKICVIDTKLIQYYEIYPLEKTSSPTILELETPIDCLTIKEGKGFSGVKSISWSGGNSQIVVTCSTSEHPVKICILTLTNNHECITKEKLPLNIYSINSIDWSPTEELLVIGFNGQIWTMQPNGNNLRYITNGWSPSWSKDGKQIALFSWGLSAEELINKKLWVEVFPGIALVNKDGTQFVWLYPPPDGKEDAISDTMITPICLGEFQSCKISWSPDNQFIVFSSKYGLNSYNWQIFKLEIKTGDIDFVTTNLSRFYSEPDWGVYK